MHKHRTNIFLVFGLMLLLFCSIKVFSQRGYENNYVNGNSSDAVNQSKANALHFDGVDDFVVIPHSKSLELNSITIELWVKSGTEVWNSMGSLISKRNDFLFHPMVGSKKIQFFFRQNDKFFYTEYTPDFDLRNWHHYAATYSKNTTHLYVDGFLAASGNNQYKKIEIRRGDLYIGCDSMMQERFFDGYIDEIRIWNYARSQAEIQQTMNVELFGNEKGLVAYYNFNQGFASENNSAEKSLFDLAKGNNGNLMNFSLQGDTSNWVESGVRIDGMYYEKSVLAGLLTLRNIIVFSVFFLIVAFLIYYRLRRQKKVQKRLEKIIAQRTEELVKENEIKDALISEIHHRVKNNLQTISSLIYFQLKTIADEEKKAGLINIQTRVNSMAVIHEMLFAKEDIVNISLNDFVNELVNSTDEMVGESRGVKVEFSVKVEDVEVGVSKAITLGLIISEIITNSIKYAFIENKKPEIQIEISKSESEFVLRIKDNGPGMDIKKTEENNKTMGLRLIRIFAKQLNAELSIYSFDGLQYVLTFKL